MEDTLRKYDVENPVKSNRGGRQSNLELFRILTMLVIVMHHYVVNSGLMSCITQSGTLELKDYFLLFFGWGGKTGIDCFVLITGYFMCTSKIHLRSYIRLFCEVEFYTIAIYIIFLTTGVAELTLKGVAVAIFPFFFISSGFTACFLLFYLFIPFLNKLIHALTEREHLLLMALCLFVYTFLPSFMLASVSFNYITWFIVIYILASYIRIYEKEWMRSTKVTAVLSAVMLLLSWCSIVFIEIVNNLLGLDLHHYFFVSDSNKFLAIGTAVAFFLFFKSLKIKQSKAINTIASATFGVLLIHANSDIMRQWLWKDTMQNVAYYEQGNVVVIHAVLVVLTVYAVCTIIDLLRIRLLEKPFMSFVDKKLEKVKGILKNG